MGRRRTPAVTLLLVMVVLGGCRSIPKIPISQPISPGPKPSPVLLKKVVAKLPRGQRVGTIYGGIAHVPQTPLTWQGGRVAFDATTYSEELRSQFEANGYEVVGDPEALFEDASEWKAEYLLGALIKDVKLNLWYPMAGYGNFSSGSGDGYLEVEWQIYSRRSRSVQLEVTTKGSAHGISITDLGPDEPLIQAFSAAAQNLLAEAQFVSLVAPVGDRPMAELAPIEIALSACPSRDDAADVIVDHARSSVVTIFAGDGHGSGFIISHDGYVLTNQHVVGDARSVTAKTVTGRELLGEVVRVNRERDVALVKLEVDRYEPLPLGKSAGVRPGSEVYAIGSPMQENLGQSISRGIVSGFRVDDDLRFIQSDVAVNPGNSGGPLLTKEGEVVGIAVMKLGPAEGINFFVPIEEALDRLAIRNGNDAAPAADENDAQDAKAEHR